MLVLFVSFSLLFGAPALLLWMGRLIERQTDVRARAPIVEKQCSGEEWYFRPPASLGGTAAVPEALSADQAAPEFSAPVEDLAWFRRPLKPLFTGFPWAGSRREHA